MDPIDGTANFVAGIPLFAISLALVDGRNSLAGVIDVPPLKERYVAIRDRGATLNGERIHVRSTQTLTDAVVATGDYSVGAETSRSHLQLAIARQLARRVRRVRMVGSAAIDLAWLASGRFDATIMLSNKPWDTAAGVIIAREAGAQVVDGDGGNHNLRSSATIAASASLMPQILELLTHAAAQF